MNRILATTTAILALAVGGCSAATADPHGGHGGGHPVPSGVPTVGIAAGTFSFEPANIALVAGQDVAIALSAMDITHDVVIDEVDFHLAADGGETVQGVLRVDEPGTYLAYCSVPGHRAAGMELTFTVEE